MQLTKPEEILALSKDAVARFISDQTSSKTFSTLMKRLNADLLDGDEPTRRTAARALDHLGFVERV